MPPSVPVTPSAGEMEKGTLWYDSLKVSRNNLPRRSVSIEREARKEVISTQ